MSNRESFQPAEGIAHVVIAAEIQRYLGPDARLRFGEGYGYWISSDRDLTRPMVEDLRLESERWRAENAQQGKSCRCV
jgi:hypothetical protein